MGVQTLILDPPGYLTPIEAGTGVAWTGDTLYKRGLLGALTSEGWVPKGSEWVMCRPFQFFRDWIDHALFPDHVVRASAWTFATGITATEFQYRTTLDESHPNDLWMRFVVPSTITGAPLSVAFDPLFQAAGWFGTPTGINVVAAAPNVSGFASPFLQAIRYPPPHDLVVFGWGDLALVLYEHDAALVRTPKQDHQTWELLALRSAGLKGPMFNGPPGGSANPAVASPSALNYVLGCFPVGWNQLYFTPSAGAEPWVVKTRDVPSRQQKIDGSPRQVPAGPWWIALLPGTLFRGQVQTVAYSPATRFTPGAPISEADSWINLGKDYTPAGDLLDTPQSPVVGVDAFLEGDTGSTIMVDIGAGVTGSNADTGESIFVNLLDEHGNAWVSDGTHFRGGMHVDLQPSGGGFIDDIDNLTTPQIREIRLDFLPLLEQGPAADLVLEGFEHFKSGWRAETSLEDPLSKRFAFELTPEGLWAILDSGLAERSDFAFELWEDIDDDGMMDFMKFAGWIILPPELKILGTEGGDPTLPLGDARYECHGVLKRADERWLWASWIAVPQAGDVPHTFAVQVALFQAGFDTNDLARVQIGLDPLAGTGYELLPGTAIDTSGDVNHKVSHAYQPTYDETKLGYITRVRDEFSRWELFEDRLGRVIYRRSRIDEVVDDGVTLAVDIVLYQTSEEAEAAGEHPDQYILAESGQHVVPPLCNAVRMIPCEADHPQVIIKDNDSINNPDSENYTGKVVRPEVLQLRMAVGGDAQRRLGRAFLNRTRRRIVRKSWTVPLAPDYFTAGGEFITMDVGKVIAVNGDDRSWYVVHCQEDHKRAELSYTTITCERIPKTVPIPVYDPGDPDG